jgi:7-cyano-7-deazaguanine synthase
MKKAVILLSGGLDSTTCLALAKSQGYECYTLSFDYGQKHVAELNAAKKIAAFYGVREHRVIELSLGNLGGSALTDATIDVPEHTGKKGISVTYVPARNTIFLSYALGLAEVLNANDIFFGGCDADNSGFPDCRPAYIAAFQTMANLATKAAVEGQHLTIHTPLIHLTKQETLALGNKLNVDYSMTVTCYQATAEGYACGKCDSCAARRQGFVDAGIKDVTRYRID